MLLKNEIDISVENGNFRVEIDDFWYRDKRSKKFIQLNQKEGTYSIIPKLENLDKRLMLLIASSIREKCGFFHVQNTDFILELPITFQKIMPTISNLNFEFRIFQYIFSVTLNDSASHLQISYSGIATDPNDEFLYDIALALYGKKSNFDINLEKYEEFWVE